MSLPRTVEDGTSGQLDKNKNQRKNQKNFEINVKFSLNFRKCKFKKIKKLKSYITTYVQKSTEINAKNKKIQQKHKTHAPLIANSKQILYYHKLHNSFTIHKYFTFRNTGK